MHHWKVSLKSLFTTRFICRFGIDCIASVLFGLEVDTINDSQHAFRDIEKYANHPWFFHNLVPLLIFLCPG